MNMNVKIFCLLSSLFFFFYSCNMETEDNIVRISINPKEVHSAELGDKFTDIELVRLESSDSVLIGAVYSLILDGDKVYVLDINTKSAFIFDKTGKSISVINNYGQGPNEYLGLSGFHLDKEKNLVLVDNGQKKKHIYTPLGEFVKVEKIPYSVKSIDYLSDGTEVVVRDMVDSSNPVGHILNVTTDGGGSYEFLPFVYQSGSTIFEKNQCVTVAANAFYYNSLSSDTIWKYSDEKLVPQYVIDFQGKGVPQDVYALGPNKFGEAFYNLILKGEIAYWPYITEVSGDKIYVTYVYNKNVCFCEYDVKSHTASQFYGPTMGNIMLSELSVGSFYTDNTLCFVLDNYKVSQLDEGRLEKLRGSYPQIYDVLSKTKLDDNPVLLLVKFKE